MRRSSLYLALVRFDMCHSNLLGVSAGSSLGRTAGPQTHPARPPLHQGCGANCDGGHMANVPVEVNMGEVSGLLPAAVHLAGLAPVDLRPRVAPVGFPLRAGLADAGAVQHRAGFALVAA